MTDFSITPEWTEQLAALSSTEKQLRLLQTVNLAGETGLEQLLDYADEAARNAPTHARTLATLCQEIARQIETPTIIPRAIYLQAQTYVLEGNAQSALALIQKARSAFVELDRPIDALRTSVGLMNALTMVGDYSATLETGRTALAEIDATFEQVDLETQDSLQMIRSKIYVNQGPAFSESGQFKEALKAYAQAEAIFESLQLTKDLAYVMNNRGVALRYLGRVDEALTAYESAAALCPDAGYFYALLLTNIGDAHLLLGDYQVSLQAYAEAQQEFDAQGLEHYRTLCKSHMADAYLALNLYPEALALYQDVISALAPTELHYYRGKALWGTAVSLYAQGDLVDATTALVQAAEIFEQLNNTPLRASLQLEQVAIYDAQGNYTAAFSLMEETFSLLARDANNAWPVQNVYAHLRMADLLLSGALPAVSDAEVHLTQAELLLQELSLPHLRYRLLQRQGHLRRLQNRNNEAQEFLEAAISEIERLRNSLATEAFRISFQQDKMDAYEELIQLYLERIAVSESVNEETIAPAFALVERAKSRVLVERMSGMVETLIDRRDDKNLTTQLHQIQARLNAVYNDILGQETGDAEEPETRGDRVLRMNHLNQQASILELELTGLRLQTSVHGQAVQPSTGSLSLQQIQQQLAPDLTMFSYYVADDEILAFVITRRKVQVVRNISTPAQVQSHLEKLNVQWGHFRVRQNFIERHLSRLEQTTQQLLHELYTDLLTPLESFLATDDTGDASAAAQKVVVVPHGLLHQVPFHALHDGKGYLIERVELSYAPSATVYTMSQQGTMHLADSALVLAVSDPAIPAVEAETQVISRTLPQSIILLNNDATLDRLSENVGRSRILHFACHGLYRMDNPGYSALKLHDGWLTATDLAQLNLEGTLVILSACESGRGTLLAGDEMMGLARACLSAGANALVVSQWLVQDDTGAMLMSEWYTRLARGQEAVSALRAAQLSLKSSHPHPYYWAPFVLVGRRAEIF